MNNKNNGIKNKILNFYNKKIKKNKVKFTMSETIIFMIVVFGLGLIVGGVIMYGKRAFSSSTISLNEFTSTYNEIVDNYYQEIDKDELLEAGISGMIKYLGDPYSTYMNKDDAEDFSEDVDGTYQGIGAEIKYNNDKLPMIGKVFENSPAEKSGLQENDIILKVNDEDVNKKSLSEIAEVVKGKEGTSVNITIKRDGKEQQIVLTRAVVDNISVTGELIKKNDKKIGYIYISIFASNTTKQFETELKKLEKENIDSLIIDVRGNSGGYLTTVTDIVSMFIKKGEIIYKLKTKEKIEVIKDKTDEKRNYPVVILTDGGSASASEVLVGAFRETYGAKTVGYKTFGKGRVQKVFTLSSGAIFKYTYQEWLTPKGNYIDQKGIEPDLEVEYKFIDENNDSQKNKAIEILSK
jgi:carboxyl-terminal processing protease